jgi:rhodanese-related sulfurtransferase
MIFVKIEATRTPFRDGYDGCMVTAQPLCAALVSGLLLAATPCLAGEFPSVTPAALEAAVSAPDGPLLLDVRTDEEFAGGHVRGALSIPLQQLPDRLEELSAFKERGVIAYCEHGRRAERALQLLRDAGFQKLQLLDGNMQRWRKEHPPAP